MECDLNGTTHGHKRITCFGGDLMVVVWSGVGPAHTLRPKLTGVILTSSCGTNGCKIDV